MDFGSLVVERNCERGQRRGKGLSGGGFAFDFHPVDPQRDFGAEAIFGSPFGDHGPRLGEVVARAFFANEEGAIVAGGVFSGERDGNLENLRGIDGARDFVGAHDASTAGVDSKLKETAFPGCVWSGPDTDTEDVFARGPAGVDEVDEVVV